MSSMLDWEWPQKARNSDKILLGKNLVEDKVLTLYLSYDFTLAEKYNFLTSMKDVLRIWGS